MRKLMLFPEALAIAACTLLMSFTHDNSLSKYVSIEKATENKLVILSISGNGKGHAGNCISLTIVNNSPDSVHYHLEAGRKLKSDDTTTQNILVVKEQMLSIAAKKKCTVQVFGFCCQAHNQSPNETSKYSVGKMADKNLVELAKFLNKKSFPVSNIQSAIWAISDNEPITSISGDDTSAVRQLRQKVASIQHVASLQHTEVSWYQLTGDIKYNLTSRGEVDISLYNEQGTLVSLLKKEFAEQGSYSLSLSTQVRGREKDKYYIVISIDGYKMEQKTVDQSQICKQ